MLLTNHVSLDDAFKSLEVSHLNLLGMLIMDSNVALSRRRTQRASIWISLYGKIGILGFLMPRLKQLNF